MQLHSNTVQLGAAPRNKQEAIEIAGQLLITAGHIEAPYIQSMFGREKQANTYLGHGIAIPHGMGPDRHYIQETGIAVVQVPQGVEWNAGETVHLAVAIAAKSDEHLQILAALMDVLDNDALIQKLSTTTDVSDILSALGSTPVASTPTETIKGKSVEAVVRGYAGLHARPAARLVEIASGFASEIYLEYAGRTASAQAASALLKLGVDTGQTVRVIANGPDADLALQTLAQEIESGLGDELTTPTAPAVKQGPTFNPVSNEPFLAGVAAAPGLAIAPLFFLRETTLQIPDEPGDFTTERAKLDEALDKASDELNQLAFAVKNRGAKEEAAIFSAHLALLNDPDLRAETEALIKAGHGVAWAWNCSTLARAEEMRGSSVARLSERAVDLQDIGTRVLRFLGFDTSPARELPDHPVILVAPDLTPSQTARLDPQRVLGLCTSLGGPTSHTAILARSLDLPCVVAVGNDVMDMPDSGATCILDGSSGRLYLTPTAEDLKAARETLQRLHGKREDEYAARFRPALLRDGHRVEVVANIGKAAEAEQAVQFGAEGVGLLRTEFLFLGRETEPTEEEQFDALREMTAALNGLPLIVRTLDIGGDKTVPYLPQTHEDNPFLGIRGARLTLRRPELFRTQLRAIFRAAETGPIRVLFPMIGTLEEWRAARKFAEEVRVEAGALPVEYGVMIEVPSAALMAREFAREVDFFSIGTNDLTQYTLAVDRLHPELGKDADALHPAVLRLISMTVEAAQAAGKWAGVCGGAAGEPLGALILAGLGVAELSMSAPSIPGVKAALRENDLAALQRLAKRALACATAPEVRALEGLA